MIFLISFIITFIIIIIIVYTYYSRENKLVEAIAFYENGEKGRALELFKAYLATRPNDIKSKQYLAKIYYEEEEPLFAAKLLVSLTLSRYATDKEKADAYAFMAQIYDEQGKKEKAIQTAMKGFKLDPKNEKLHYQMGLIYIKNEKIDRAIKELNLVLHKNRLNLDARMSLAKLHEERGEEIKSIFQYKKILEINPSYEKASYKLGEIYYKKNDYKNASLYLEQIKEKEKSWEIDYYYMLINSYIKLHKMEKVKTELENIVLGNNEKNEKITFMRYELGNIYEMEGEKLKAYKLYEEITQDIPKYRDIITRMNKLKKELFPEEHAKMIEKIDYNNSSEIDFKELCYKIIGKLGYKEMKLIKDTRNKLLVLASEKFKTLLQGKYLIGITKSPTAITAGEVGKFISEFEGQEADRGIMVSTSTYTEQAIKLVKEYEIELLDKVDIFEILGE
ncbi:MAG: hypothetical protein B6I28_01935 [Fusobacteriia bacterium 4572_132]|nr:MAG: hypothetical protein B6I28_01935 [Fusobacteriia bacterium 4572_132]